MNRPPHRDGEERPDVEAEPPTRIVVAEDDPTYLRMLTSILSRWGYETFAARNGEEAWKVLAETEAQIVVTDWTMPGMSGVDLCRKVRDAALPYYVYSLLLTSRSETKEIVEGLSSGADDYLTKPINPAELRARVRVGERVVRMEAELRETRARLEITASTDELTGVANRRALLGRLQEELSQSARSRAELSVAMIDIDGFKALNDTYGHAAGDRVLREVVNRVVAQKREYDIVGRLGGEEFVVLLPDTDLSTGHPVAERLRASVAESPMRLEDGTEIDVTFSVGLACAAPNSVDSVDTLLARADRALYRAKQNGRNRVEVVEAPVEVDVEIPSTEAIDEDV